MTIAAGLLTTEGVLVCADRQITAGLSKLEGVKVGGFEASWGNVIVAYAGNVDYAVSAFQMCERAKESSDVKPSPIQSLDGLLADRYRENVFAHPRYETGGYDYHLLLGVRLTGEKRARLYRTYETEFREIRAFECAGTGEDSARDLLRYLYNSNAGFDWAVALASYAISHVTERVQYCGGMPDIRLLGHDGTYEQDRNKIARLERLAMHFEKVGNWFVWECQKFLLHHAFGDIRRFTECSKALDARAVYMRNFWEDAMREGKVDPKATRPDSSRLPPWPE